MSQLFFENSLIFYFHGLIVDGLTPAYCLSTPEYNRIIYFDERPQV